MKEHAQVPITFGNLVREMIDLNRLTAFPEPEYRTLQFSSYDRGSVAPYAPGWFDNSDGFGGERTPNFLQTLKDPDAEGTGDYLMAEVDGPGAIVRTWTPDPGPPTGRMTVYLDGQKEPFFDGPSEKFLRYRYEHLAGFAERREGFTQRDASYFPIPFAKGLRIVYTGKVKEIHFYHIQVRKYVAGTAVKTFEPADLKTWADDVERISAVLARRGDDPAMNPMGGKRVEINCAVEGKSGIEGKKGQENDELFKVEGPGAIEELTLKIEAADLTRALREIVLTGYFDGSPNAQVEAPIGAFFASAPGVISYESIPMSVKRDGTMTCRFKMPFAKTARFVVQNMGAQAARVSGAAVVGEGRWVAGRTMHFHAKWKVDHNVIAGVGDEAMDMPFLVARGQGAYVGTALMLMNPTDYITGWGSWWGEGDEKVWVDDDTFPSIFGTGSEDYFNFSWGVCDMFHHAYFGQPFVTGPCSGGNSVDTRWHIMDPIPFKKHIDFYMELWHHMKTPGFSYARVAYFYAMPWLRDAHIRIKPDDVLFVPQFPENWQPKAMGEEESKALYFHAEDALKGKEKGEGVRIVQDRMWAGGKMLRWQPKGSDEKLEFEIDVPQAGTYELMCVLAKSPESGRVMAEIDGRVMMKDAVDLYIPEYLISRNAGLGRFELAAGKHTVTLRTQGKNPASAGNAVGIDFFWLVPRAGEKNG